MAEGKKRWRSKLTIMLGADQPKTTARGESWDRRVGAGYLTPAGNKGGKMCTLLTAPG
jgi:hypothetical protein